MDKQTEGKTIKNKQEIVQLHLSARSVYWSQYIGKDIKRAKAPKFKATTMQIKSPKRLLWGNPKPRAPWNYLLFLSPHSASIKMFLSTIPKTSSHFLTRSLGAQECRNGW